MLFNTFNIYVQDNTVCLSNLSARNPIKGVAKNLGIIAMNVTNPAQPEESVMTYTNQPRATIKAQAADPAQTLAIHKVR